MDIKQLNYLCALERERHFGRAAQACCITQPTLSMRIRQLEDELGIALVRRGKQFEGFTPEGERVLARARNLLSQYDNLKLEVEAMKGSLTGTVRLGLVPLSCMDLSPILALLRRRYPGLSFEINDMTADAILQGLENNSLDIGGGFFEPEVLARLNSLALPEQGVTVAFGPAWRERMPLEPMPADLAQLPLCLPKTGMYFRRYLETVFARQGVTLQPMLASNSVYRLMRAVHSDLGCALIPAGSALFTELPGVECRPLALPAMTRLGALVMRGDEHASLLARGFFDVARELWQP
ncbi:LysR family transcriptional regulator [Oceanisphaera arctica]|uniref:LysR family transcriptional regulator n=1 Tax=Oceanisphaera arctica TaxID=641510 RepID=A0A2P5TJD2_9GAMM|nr:LysR family transcriptional regulator [Oceanisphaera arctica]PPL15036.1 LysR family transcriptional regulator [Oceanisphaera arctica]GHA14948.1 LysR family transcriptional regulator [Oceanisphaera arctica]